MSGAHTLVSVLIYSASRLTNDPDVGFKIAAEVDTYIAEETRKVEDVFEFIVEAFKRRGHDEVVDYLRKTWEVA